MADDDARPRGGMSAGPLLTSAQAAIDRGPQLCRAGNACFLGYVVETRGGPVLVDMLLIKAPDRLNRSPAQRLAGFVAQAAIQD